MLSRWQILTRSDFPYNAAAWLHAWPPYLKALRKYRREYGTRALMTALRKDWRKNP